MYGAARVGRKNPEDERVRRVPRVGQVRQGRAECHHRKKSSSANRVRERVQQQHGGEGEHLPELLVGNEGQQAQPKITGKDSDGEREKKLEEQDRSDRSCDRTVASRRESCSGEQIREREIGRASCRKRV